MAQTQILQYHDIYSEFTFAIYAMKSDKRVCVSLFPKMSISACSDINTEKHFSEYLHPGSLKEVKS